MHSVRTRCPRLVVGQTIRSGIWRRSYSTSDTAAQEQQTEWDGLYRPSEKFNILKSFNQLPPEHVKHPKIPTPIKPFSAKHTPETDPWLFMMGAFPKSVQELNKEAVC